MNLTDEELKKLGWCCRKCYEIDQLYNDEDFRIWEMEQKAIKNGEIK